MHLQQKLCICSGCPSADLPRLARPPHCEVALVEGSVRFLKSILSGHQGNFHGADRKVVLIKFCERIDDENLVDVDEMENGECRPPAAVTETVISRSCTALLEASMLTTCYMHLYHQQSP